MEQSNKECYRVEQWTGVEWSEVEQSNVKWYRVEWSEVEQSNKEWYRSEHG